jgi:hypothetical protein
VVTNVMLLHLCNCSKIQVFAILVLD